jgi:hypothetical protein
MYLDSFLDPQDPRWQIENFENSTNNSVWIESECVRISRWFDPPFISPRQEAVALPLSIGGMFAAFAKVFLASTPLFSHCHCHCPGFSVPTSHLCMFSSSLK